MSDAYCDLEVATYALPQYPTLEEIEDLVVQLKSHGDATYGVESVRDEDSEGTWFYCTEFVVTKRFSENTSEYAKWSRAEAAREFAKREQQARQCQRVKEVKERADRARDTAYWNYIYDRSDEMRRIEAKCGPCPRWIGYVPTYTKEACGVSVDDDRLWGK